MSRPADIRRRRLAVLGALAAAAAGAGVWAGAGTGSDGEPRRANRVVPPPGATVAAGEPAPAPAPAPEEAPAEPSRPTTAALRREAGQTIVLRIRGTSAPAYVLRALRQRRVAGVILFRDNVVSAPQLRRMTRAFHRAAGGRTLVMIDQEGGAIRNVPWAAPVAAPPGQTTAAAATAAARATARDLRAVGVNVNLAPVADVGTYPGSVMRSRAYPGGPAQVGALVAASLRGYARTGVLPTAKHFPGLGRSQTNTDFRPATVPGRGDLAPFAAAVRAGVPLVMASHALHPELDEERIASQSSRILRGLLRDRLRFRGACITDSLEAQAVVQRSSTPAAAERSMRAGCDLLLTTGRASYLQVMLRLVASARRDPQLRRRMAEARRRIDALPRR